VTGYNFGFDKSAAHYNANKSKAALLSALAESGVLPKRRFSSPEEMEEAFKNTRDLLIDAAERPCFRTADYETRKKHFSGKRHARALKNTAISNAFKYFLFSGYTSPGSMHDYGLFKTEFPPEEDRFKNFNLWLDSGFSGIQNDYNPAGVNIPHKKQRKSKKNPNPCLTEKQKEENRKTSEIRVIAERAAGGMKRFGALTAEFRNKTVGFADDVAIPAAGLWNLKLSVNK